MNDSPTPRTDAEAIGSCGTHSPEMVRSVFARQLERELNDWKCRHEQARLGGQKLAADRDRLMEYASHGPFCPAPGGYGECDCGFKELMEKIEPTTVKPPA